MQEQQYELEVLVNGKPVQEYLHQGKTFIEGKEGTEFSLRLRNRSNKRALFVPTIDGLSVMNGKEASFDSSGYIVGAYSTETIDGWRTSDDDVAKFFFAKVAESYAARTGKAGNVGVIGCAVFREKEQPKPIVIKEYIPYPVYQRPTCPWGHLYCNNIHGCTGNYPCNGYGGGGGGSGVGLNHSGGYGGASGAGGMGNLASLQASSAGAQFSASATGGSAMSLNTSALTSALGTGFGEQKHSPVRTVEFERESQPAIVFAINYNTRKTLEDIGVEFKRPLYVAPSAFPKENGYCQPPQN